MNNERYLFRGMRKGEPHEFIYGDLNYILGEVYVIDRGVDAPLNSFDWSEVIPETVGQFTGLLDKNGLKVFEGDRLSNPSGIYGNVEYSNGSFKLKRTLRGEKYFNLNQGYCANKEIIGSIHTIN